MASTPTAIDVVCVRGAGTREAPAIVDSLITSEALAVARGRAFIDEHWWRQRRARFSIPFVEDLRKDGQVADLRAPGLAYGGKVLVTALRGRLTLSPRPSLSYEVEAEEITEPPDA